MEALSCFARSTGVTRHMDSRFNQRLTDIGQNSVENNKEFGSIWTQKGRLGLILH